ncbi:hypothetical protein [Aureliella helgolandensis]|uniref:D12 class N6 adenine-specific DNA methyltransferase n=1 Tax=Aureliella helgolandensis TaxID=2527968 RepID=A0A518GDN9_9BACT|nr:hypothetical protein [Aureliella helgolandensis]QDV26719.1 D12 class N6 adenine-specific DNA methyltransferase [Aureliella helgolandensis]
MRTESKKLRTKSALSYFGSDSEVAAELAAKLNGCRHITIAFAGGLSILPHLTARGIVANDLNAHAMNFYRVAAGRHGEAAKLELAERCATTLSHPEELELAAKAMQFFNTPSTRDYGCAFHAWAYWACCWLPRKGKGGTKSPPSLPSVRREATGGNNASRLVSVAADLNTWAQQFRRCEFESVCFRDLLRKVKDTAACGIYCDPPWVGAGNNYMHSFALEDHVDLADALARFRKAAVLIRYGDAPLIRELYREWRIEERFSRTQANSQIGELWITRA